MKVLLNGEERELTEGLTIAGLVREIGLRPEQVAVECNRELVPRAHHAETPLGEGDVLELVTLVGGG
jgi:thiamine biosynthesis protein ThiS